ncbi:MAG: HAD family hydrolase, partial [bacterium]
FRDVLSHVGTLGYETGKVRTDKFLQEMNVKMGSDISVAEFTTLWNSTFEEDPDMAALFLHLGRSYPLYLLSNTNENHYEFLQGKYNVARHFRELILSYEVGLAKPDQGIYQEVLSRSGLTAAECLFVDDLEVNVKAAQALGMRTIQFVGVADLKERLTAHGVACS